MAQKTGEAYIKLRSILMMPKNKSSLDMLKFWYTEEDAEMLASGPFKVVLMDSYTIEEFAQKTGYPTEKVQKTFERLARRGSLFWVMSENKKKYSLPPLFPGLVEFFIISPHNSFDERRKFIEKFHDPEKTNSLLSHLADFSVFRVVPGLKPGPEKRVLDVDKKMETDKSQVLVYEDVEQIIKQAGKRKGNIAIMPCTCRTMAMIEKSSPECKASIHNCMVFGPAAKFVVDEGIGRHVDVEECLDILKQAEKEGLVHVTQNTKDKQGFICNCCTCCCGILSTSIKLRYDNFVQKSDYVPAVDQDKCSKCKKCINLCGFSALIYHEGDAEDKSKDRISVREDVCIGCGVCASNCPKDAMSLKKIRSNLPADNMVEALLKMMGKGAHV